jgi:hypothetical protein
VLFHLIDQILSVIPLSADETQEKREILDLKLSGHVSLVSCM